jgi:hypothetical protein
MPVILYGFEIAEELYLTAMINNYLTRQGEIAAEEKVGTHTLGTRPGNDAGHVTGLGPASHVFRRSRPETGRCNIAS